MDPVDYCFHKHLCLKRLDCCYWPSAEVVLCSCSHGCRTHQPAHFNLKEYYEVALAMVDQLQHAIYLTLSFNFGLDSSSRLQLMMSF